MEWYYANENDQQIPLDEGNLEDLIAIGTVKKNTLVWHEGMGDWKECGQVKPELFAVETEVATTPAADGAPSLSATSATTPSPPPMTGQPPAVPSYPVAPQQDGLAITSMICGIVGVSTFWCWGIGLIPGIIAVITGYISKKNLAAGAKSPMATAGLVMGWITLVISVLMIVLFIYLGVNGHLD